MDGDSVNRRLPRSRLRTSQLPSRHCLTLYRQRVEVAGGTGDVVMPSYGVASIANHTVQSKIKIDFGPAFTIRLNNRTRSGNTTGIVSGDRIVARRQPEHDVFSV